MTATDKIQEAPGEGGATHSASDIDDGNPDFQIFTSLRSDALLLTCPQNHQHSSSPPTPTQFYMLNYHRDRLLAAAQAFNWDHAIRVLSGNNGLAKLDSQLHEHLLSAYGDANYPDPLKVRVEISWPSSLSVTSSPTPTVDSFVLFPHRLYESPMPAPNFPMWRVYVCPNSVPASKWTSHKTTHREVYDRAREQIPTLPQWLITSDATERTEILLQNPDGYVSECSISTPYFFKRGKDEKGKWKGEGRWITPQKEDGGNLGVTRSWALEQGLVTEEAVKANELKLGDPLWISNGVRGWRWGRIDGFVEKCQDWPEIEQI
ncbi:MAG: hypothetical protein MMC33_002550 [Icmadophila ericetorum]|nr:hypothetical protein [Icmadophila ericetorum]